MRQVISRPEAECETNAERSPSPQTPHPRATDARSRGIKFPISYSKLVKEYGLSHKDPHGEWPHGWSVRRKSKQDFIVHLGGRDFVRVLKTASGHTFAVIQVEDRHKMVRRVRRSRRPPSLR